MVTTLNVPLDDAVYEQLREQKEEIGLTWPEYFETAAAAVDADRGGQERAWRERQAEVQEAVDDLGLVENDLPGRDDELATVAVDDLDLPGSGETLEARREAIQELYTYLQREGSATRSDFLELVDADLVGYASAESFWSNCIKGRDSLRVLPGVEAPAEGEHRWRFIGFDDTSH